MPVFDRSIDLVSVSHPDLDHYEGLIEVLKRYRVTTCHLPHIISNSTAYSRLLSEMYHRCNIVFPAAGDILTGQGYIMSFLWPEANKTHFLTVNEDDRNSHSLVFLLTVGTTTVLFTGDATSEVLDALPLSENTDVDILKIPHHGARDGITSDFLVRTQPSVAVISVGESNSYGHPHEEVLKKIVRLQLPVRRTDMEGDIGFGIGITD